MCVFSKKNWPPVTPLRTAMPTRTTGFAGHTGTWTQINSADFQVTLFMYGLAEHGVSREKNRTGADRQMIHCVPSFPHELLLIFWSGRLLFSWLYDLLRVKCARNGVFIIAVLFYYFQPSLKLLIQIFIDAVSYINSIRFYKKFHVSCLLNNRAF